MVDWSHIFHHISSFAFILVLTAQWLLALPVLLSFSGTWHLARLNYLKSKINDLTENKPRMSGLWKLMMKLTLLILRVYSFYTQVTICLHRLIFHYLNTNSLLHLELLYSIYSLCSKQAIQFICVASPTLLHLYLAFFVPLGSTSISCHPRSSFCLNAFSPRLYGQGVCGSCFSDKSHSA